VLITVVVEVLLVEVFPEAELPDDEPELDPLPVLDFEPDDELPLVLVLLPLDPPLLEPDELVPVVEPEVDPVEDVELEEELGSAN
jgi:hypothetical protein